MLICENGHFIIIYSLRWRENNGPVLPWHTQSLEKFLRHVLQLFRRGRERRHLRAIRCLIVGLPPSYSPFFQHVCKMYFLHSNIIQKLTYSSWHWPIVEEFTCTGHKAGMFRILELFYYMRISENIYQAK